MKSDSILHIAIVLLTICHNVKSDFYPDVALDEHIIAKDMKCLVCKATVKEMKKVIVKVDPRKKVEVSGFRMDVDGNNVAKTVQLSKSETYLTELMEEICDKLDDYAKVKHKKTGKIDLITFMSESGGMNPLISEVQFIQDGDLNKSLKHYCLEILEDNEIPALQLFMQDKLADDLDEQLCRDAAKYCRENDDDDEGDDASEEEINADDNEFEF